MRSASELSSLPPRFSGREDAEIAADCFDFLHRQSDQSVMKHSCALQHTRLESYHPHFCPQDAIKVRFIDQRLGSSEPFREDSAPCASGELFDSANKESRYLLSPRYNHLASSRVSLMRAKFVACNGAMESSRPATFLHPRFLDLTMKKF